MSFSLMEQRFLDYVNNIIRQNECDRVNYDLKVEHTYRVVDNIKILCKSLGLEQSDVEIAEAIGIFHDIGRFKQFSEFKSFSDKITGSHADMSVELIEQLGLLIEFNTDNQTLIKDSIRFHNYFLLPTIADNRLLLYSKLIRDADKLDAFWGEVKSNTDTRRYTLSELSGEKEYSDEVVNDILSNRQVDFKNLKYSYDRRLGILGLIFDISLSESFEIIKKNRYVELILEPLKDSQEKQMMLDTCTRFVEKNVRI